MNHGTNRRSYGMESVEDDPFIEAHSASQQSMAFSDTGKRKPNNVNYGYMSQGETPAPFGFVCCSVCSLACLFACLFLLAWVFLAWSNVIYFVYIILN